MMNYDEYVISVEKSLDKFLTDKKLNLKKLKNLIFKEYMLQYMYKVNNGEQDFKENVVSQIAEFFNTTISKVNTCLSSVKNWAIKRGYIDKSPRNDINRLTAVFIVDFLKECGVTNDESN